MIFNDFLLCLLLFDKEYIKAVLSFVGSTDVILGAETERFSCEPALVVLVVLTPKDTRKVGDPVFEVRGECVGQTYIFVFVGIYQVYLGFSFLEKIPEDLASFAFLYLILL